MMINEFKWNMIPDRCEYNGKIYRILDIEMQGGYFTLQDMEAKIGDVQVLDNIDMDKCNPIETEETIENKIIECLNEADDKLDTNDFNKLSESIIYYIDDISRSKKKYLKIENNI